MGFLQGLGTTIINLIFADLGVRLSDSMIFMGPFKLGVFYDSISWCISWKYKYPNDDSKAWESWK